jgi:hypothetical protein
VLGVLRKWESARSKAGDWELWKVLGWECVLEGTVANMSCSHDGRDTGTRNYALELLSHSCALTCQGPACSVREELCCLWQAS